MVERDLIVTFGLVILIFGLSLFPIQAEDYLIKMEEISGETLRIINQFVEASKNYKQGILTKSGYGTTVEQAQNDIIAISISLSLIDAPTEYESGHKQMIDAIDRFETSISSMLGYLSSGSITALGNAANYLEWGTRELTDALDLLELKKIFSSPYIETEYLDLMTSIISRTKNLKNSFGETVQGYLNEEISKGEAEKAVKTNYGDLCFLLIETVGIIPPNSFIKGHSYLVEALSHYGTSMSSMLGYLSSGSSVALENVSSYLDWGNREFNNAEDYLIKKEETTPETTPKTTPVASEDVRMLLPIGILGLILIGIKRRRQKHEV